MKIKKCKRSLKRTFALALSLVMLLLLCPVIHAEASDVTTYDVGAYKGDKAETEWTYPTQEGKVFAGWYTDETYTKVYEDTTGEAYAKFVNDNMLVVKKQLNSGAVRSDDKANIRFLTAIDSLNYSNVTFHVAMPATDKQWTMTETTAYSSVLVDGVTYPYTAEQVFGDGAVYFVVHSLKGIPQNAFDNDIQVSVSWETLDGTVVTVKQSSFSVGYEMDYASGACACKEADCEGAYGYNGICSADETHYQAAVLNETDSVYEISNAGQLFWFAAKVNSEDYNINGILMKDIDLENREWTPIGNFDGDARNIDKAYKGSFDGNGKTISGLKLTATTDEKSNVGLFGVVIGGTIQNFTVNGEIQIAVNDGDGRIGVIGQCDSTTVSGIKSSVNITVADGAKSYYVGGVVGDIQRNSTVEKCVWYGAIDAGTCSIGSFGGIVGRTGPSTITNCASYGTLQGAASSSSQQLHGIIGLANNASMNISNCLFAGNVEASGSYATAVTHAGTNCKDRISTVLDNIYYAEGSATKIVLYNGKDGTGTTEYDTLQQTLAKTVKPLTKEQLSNGEAVSLLNGDAADGVWKLDTFTINGEEYTLPGFDGETVKAG